MQSKFKHAKNELRKLSRQLRKTHEGKLAQGITRNPKVFWKYVRSKLKQKLELKN